MLFEVFWVSFFTCVILWEWGREAFENWRGPGTAHFPGCKKVRFRDWMSGAVLPGFSVVGLLGGGGGGVDSTHTGYPLDTLHSPEQAEPQLCARFCFGVWGTVRNKQPGYPPHLPCAV